MAATAHRAKPPHKPTAPVALLSAQAEQAKERRLAEHRERSSVVRGLLLLVLLVILIGILRAGLDRAFPHGWWHR